jgi:hypothetical protein
MPSRSDPTSSSLLVLDPFVPVAMKDRVIPFDSQEDRPTLRTLKKKKGNDGKGKSGGKGGKGGKGKSGGKDKSGGKGGNGGMSDTKVGRPEQALLPPVIRTDDLALDQLLLDWLAQLDVITPPSPRNVPSSPLSPSKAPTTMISSDMPSDLPSGMPSVVPSMSPSQLLLVMTSSESNANPYHEHTTATIHKKGQMGSLILVAVAVAAVAAMAGTLIHYQTSSPSLSSSSKPINEEGDEEDAIDNIITDSDLTNFVK